MDALKAEFNAASPDMGGWPESRIVVLAPRIEADPARLNGKPCIRGTRFRVADMLGLLAAGMTPDEIVRDYPSIELEDVPAALEYAQRRMLEPVVFDAITLPE